MKYTQFLTLIGTTIAGTFLATTPASALDFSFNTYDSNTGTFSYDVTLSAGETLNINDPLALTGLAGVTNVDSTSNADLQFSNTFDSISADFQVTDGATGANTFSEAIILTSNSPLGQISYSANSSAGAFSGSVQGPALSSTAVPFEFSPSLGLLSVLSLMGFNYYRRKFQASKL
jgi:hypothetical protein